MKIKIEPAKFQKLLKSGMVCHTRPLLDPMTLTFTPDAATVKDVYSEVLAVYIKLSKAHFQEFQAKEETITIPFLVNEKLGWGFNDPTITVSTDAENEKITLKGKHDSFTTEIEATDPHKFPFELVETEHGTLRKDFECKTALKLDAKELKLPVAEQYNFEFKKDKLTVTIQDGGDFEHTFQAEPIAKEDTTCMLSGEYYNAIIDNLEGEITLFLTPNVAVFCEKKENISKTYFLSALMEQ